MENISDWLTHIDNKEDLQYLRTKLPDVNMRLFKVNQSYRAIVLSCCKHLSHVCLSKLDGYKLPHGVSGANVAIPFNIIAIHKERGFANAWPMVMINPKITDRLPEKITAETNCGSIRLKSPIKVERYLTVKVSFWDKLGEFHEEWFARNQSSLTIQHEIDHNLGILITDRQLA